MGNRAYLQGTHWYYEQMHKTCKDGSKYCVYNHKICSNKTCRYYHKQCAGKGNYDWFDHKAGTPKIYCEKTFKTSKQDKKEKNMSINTVNQKKYLLKKKRILFV